MGILKAFGRSPKGTDGHLYSNFSNYTDGKFSNLSETIMMAKGVSFPRLLWKFMNRPRICYPEHNIPTIKSNLKSPEFVNANRPVLIWFGHSSYLVFIHGLTILVDPVFCGHASPFSFNTKSFPGTDIYSVDDLPPIDILLITHDHYDHLDWQTIVKLRPKAKLICTSLGVGSHLVFWGWEKDKIREFGWGDSYQIDEATELIAAPARHFSGRGFARNKTLWSSFILTSGNFRIFIGGDSGYDVHFSKIGITHGPFDIVMLECGQYSKDWPFIHMMPEETVQAAIDLRGRLLMPVHWGKFSLSLHPWNEPIRRVREAAFLQGMPITTPHIGEPVIPGEQMPGMTWWEEFEPKR
jgi:L-ascorbate metabolism protein UlaG (beta-lactamase superfamily)